MKNGTVVLKKNALVGGTFVLDMTSINATDLQGEYQQKLNGHLKMAISSRLINILLLLSKSLL